MSLDLTSARAKMDAAIRHMKTLEGELGVGIWPKPKGPPPIFRPKPNRVTLLAEFDPKTGDHIVRVQKLPLGTLNLLATIFGDAVHNFRATLDHLVYQFALEHHKGRIPENIEKTIQFRIYERSEDFWNSSVVAHIETVRAKALARLQPYNGANGSLIRALYDMDIRDKHKLLIPMIVRPAGLIRLPTGTRRVHYIKGSKRIEVDAKIASLILPLNAKPKVKGYLTPHVALDRWGHPCRFLEAAEGLISAVLNSAEKGRLPPRGRHGYSRTKRVETYEEVSWE